MPPSTRPDLPNQRLHWLLAFAVVVYLITLFLFTNHKPGSPIAQWAAFAGTTLLTVPMLFSITKRSGLSDSPPFWFVSHVLCATLGMGLIMLHVAGGNWFSPPGLIWLLMIFLLFQGVLLRTTVSKQFSELFARNSARHGFRQPPSLDKTMLAKIIEQKTSCLKQLDEYASEALFSLTLRHWFTRPRLSLRYQSLINTEVRMIGARQTAGRLRAWSRRIHLLAAMLFYVGLLTHIIIVLFFAGYAAGNEPVDWWYITDWGR